MYSVKFNFKELDNLQKRSEELDEGYQNAIIISMKKLGEYAIEKAKLNTAVGVYNPYVKKGEVINEGKVGGQLKNAWNRTGVIKRQNSFSVEVFNPLEYAQFYEYGHRQTPGRYVPQIGKRLKKEFVEGRFPLKKAMDRTEKVISKIITIEINKVGK